MPINVGPFELSKSKTIMERDPMSNPQYFGSASLCSLGPPE
jgi:hypothetical protein